MQWKTMILHMYTIIRVLISLVGIFTGLIVLFGMLEGKRLDSWTKWFLITTVLTSVTGFFFPFRSFTPAIGLGILSLLVLAVAIYARYPRELAGHWRWIYVVTAVVAVYFNVFVGVVQSFEKYRHCMPSLRHRPSSHLSSHSWLFWCFSLYLPLPRRSGFASNRSVRLKSKR